MIRRIHSRLPAASLIVSCVLAGSGLAQGVDTQRIIEADSEPQNWMSWGRTYDEQRFSPLEQINEDNVGELGLAWHYDLDTQDMIEGTPLAIDGVLYFSSAWNITSALDARTGELLWRYDPEINPQSRSYACCGPVSRGIAAWGDAIIIATLDGRLISLDAATGQPNWETQTLTDEWPYSVTGAPRAADGKIFIGNGGADMGARGYVSAYDADTGEFLWRFYTVPGNPADGFENAAMEMAAETWSGEWWTLGGGGTAWDSIVYDPEFDRVYIGTGNGSPWPAWERSPGGGDNLFLASIVAVDADTGEYAWHYQQVPGESWDFTSTAPMMLADLEIEGRTRKVLMQAPKNGFFYVIDRESGELISAEKFVGSNWASHIDMETGRPVVLETADWSEQGRFIGPSGGGGHSWRPMTFSPETGYVYLGAREIWLYYKRDPEWTPTPFRSNSAMGGQTEEEAEYYGDLATDMRLGWLQAWDPVRQREVWRVPHSGAGQSGVLATAGNLLFQSNHDLEFAAYRATSGERLWSMPIQTFGNAGPISYAVDGEQYIAFAAGGGGGRGTTETPRSDGRLLVFKLGGTHTLPPMATDVAQTEPVALAELAPGAAGLVDEGRRLYTENCALCHGQNAVSEGTVPVDLRQMTPQTHAMFEEIVIGGAYIQKGMASFDAILDPPDVEAIHAYLISRQNEDFGHN